MDYEQRYRDALRRAKKLYEHGTITESLGWVFPEIKESKDERIRKTLIAFFRDWERTKSHCWNVKVTDIIAWLEKQGTKEVDPRYENLEELLVADNIYQMSMNDAMVEEAKSKAINALSELAISKILGLEKQCEKPTDKVEPKFHEGEWLCGNEPNNYARFIQILEIVNVQGKERYRISRDIHNDEDTVDFGFVEKYYHKFDIQDAKDGDILVASDGSIFLFAGVDDCACKYYAALTTDNYFKINKEAKGGYWETSRAVYPATKEQRDALTQAMADAGYEFVNGHITRF